MRDPRFQKALAQPDFRSTAACWCHHSLLRAGRGFCARATPLQLRPARCDLARRLGLGRRLIKARVQPAVGMMSVG